MRKNFLIFLTLAAVMAAGVFLSACANRNSSSASLAGTKEYEFLKSRFADPPQEYGTSCWWWWLNGNVNKEAITKDLEAMKAKKFQGAMIFDAGGYNQGGNLDVPAGPVFGGKEWRELFVFALSEAKRLGLEIGFNIQSGWNLGGPIVTPEYSAKKLVYSEKRIQGGSSVSVELEQPEAELDYYKDIAVLAFPLGKISSEGIDNLNLKLASRELGGSAPDCRFLLKNTTKTKDAYLADPDEVMDISEYVDESGNLKWDAPEGEWSILRFGYTCTGAKVSTSSNEWQGLVLDYLSSEAFDFYWNTVVDPILSDASEYEGTTLKFMETDSWECGGMNWSDNFRNEFMDYNGYDLIKYLPIAAGFVVGSVDDSNSFLADFRKTIAEMILNNHYSRFAERAHEHGMYILPESAGPHAGPFDGIQNYGRSDIVMSEFWARSPHRPTPGSRFFVKQAASAAHIYGKKIVGAESFTTIGPHWNDELWENQKPSFDHEICAGLNRVYFHTFTCSPSEMGIPGQQYFAGTHVNPEVTWWNRSEAFIDYLRRNQLLSQSGSFCADVLYYYGDHIPNIFSNKFSDPAKVLPGYDYDVTDEEILLSLKVKDGRVVVPSGLEYGILALPDSKILSLEALQKVCSLLKDGATVLGPKPEYLVSLKGGKKAKEIFSKTADSIWGADCPDKGEKKYGRGTVAWGVTANEYLSSHGVKPDFAIDNFVIEPGPDTTKGNEDVIKYTHGIDYIHYKLSDSDLYFIVNQRQAKVRFNAEFRVAGLKPELWNAIDGSVRYLDAYKMSSGVTSVPFVLEPYESAIVIFHEKAEADGAGLANYSEYSNIAVLGGPWSVSFDPEWGGPDKPVIFKTLTDWTTNPVQGIKYYSGKAIYKISFDFSPKEKERYCIELGDVRDVGIATVKLNGKELGTLWTSPFRVEVTSSLVEGKNDLEVEVINSWYNRVAGDEMGVSEKKYTNTNIILGRKAAGDHKASVRLQPSGLLGPVSLRKMSASTTDL